MSARPWMPLYVGDYLADTPHLNTSQHGAYLLLIMYYWQKGSIPDDDAQLAQIVRMPLAEWRRHRPVIRAFFSSGWKHRRIDNELALSAEKYRRRAEAGRKGGKSHRWSSNAQAMLNQSQSQSQSQDKSLSHGEGITYQGKTLGSEARRLTVVGGLVLAADGQEGGQ